MMLGLNLGLSIGTRGITDTKPPPLTPGEEILYQAAAWYSTGDTDNPAPVTIFERMGAAAHYSTGDLT